MPIYNRIYSWIIDSNNLNIYFLQKLKNYNKRGLSTNFLNDFEINTKQNDLRRRIYWINKKMNFNFLKDLKIEEILIIIFPFLIITGPAIPDISALLLILIILYKVYKYKNFRIDNNYWIYIFYIMNLWFIFISFFSYIIL